MTKKLTIYDDVEQRLYGIDPGNATGIPIPAFNYGVTRPQVGSVVGQAFINQTTGIASVWDGNTWTDIAKPVIIHYPSDNALLADAPPANTVALSEQSGNVFVRIGVNWLPLGMRVYPTVAGMQLDTPPDGTTAFAQDTTQFAIRAGNQWNLLTQQQNVTVATTAPANPLGGHQWLDNTDAANPVFKIWDGTKWVETSAGSKFSHGTAGHPNAKEGDLWWDTRSNALRMLIGGHWSTAANYDSGAHRPGTSGRMTGTVFYDSTAKALSMVTEDGWKQIGSKDKAVRFESTDSTSGSPLDDLHEYDIGEIDFVWKDKTNNGSLLLTLASENDHVNFIGNGNTESDYRYIWHKMNAGGMRDSGGLVKGASNDQFIDLGSWKRNSTIQFRIRAINCKRSELVSTINVEAMGLWEDGALAVYHAQIFLTSANVKIRSVNFSMYTGEKFDASGVARYIKA